MRRGDAEQRDVTDEIAIATAWWGDRSTVNKVLTERVLSIISQYDVAGGLTQQDIILEIARGGDGIDSDYTEEKVRDVIWFLLQDARIRIDHAKKLRLIRPKVTFDMESTWSSGDPFKILPPEPYKRPDPEPKKLPHGSTSGIWPVGPGDGLYNNRAERIATVTGIWTDKMGRAIVEIESDVERFLSLAPGTSNLNTYGEVVAASGKRLCGLDHDALQDELVRKNQSGSCPDCGTHLCGPRKWPSSRRERAG